VSAKIKILYVTFQHENIARKMFEYMLSTNDEQLKKDINKELEECKLPPFQEQDFTFICEMIDDPIDIGKHVVRNITL
jgi:hypothetical protein